MICNGCDASFINGVLCHEEGCSDAWRDETRECDECGGKFKPEERLQTYCCVECFMDANGIPHDDEYNEDDEVERVIERDNDEWASRDPYQ